MMIGFDGAVDRANIMEAGLGDFKDFRFLVEKDIRKMADEFGKRTAANGRIVFGLERTKKLTGVMHWLQDCYKFKRSTWTTVLFLNNGTFLMHFIQV